MADTWAVVNGAVQSAAPKISNAVNNLPKQLSSKIPAGTIATVGNAIGQVDAKLAKAAAALQVPPVTNPTAYIEGIGWGTGTPTSAAAAAAKASPAASNANTNTYSGTAPATNPETVRTTILDPTKGEVNLILDSFLQGLAGGLSSILGQGLNNFLGSLPGTVQQLLSSTGLTGALGSALSNFDAALGNALGGMSNALGNMAGKIAGDFGKVVGNIPGVGPVFQGLTKGIGDFSNNLSNAVNGLPTDLKTVISAASAQVGANLIGKAFKKPDIVKNVGVQVARNIAFKDNPAKQLIDIANSANRMNLKTFKTTGDKIFSQVGQAAKKAAKKFSTKLFKKNPWYLRFSQLPIDPVVNKVENGKLYTTKERREIFGEKNSPAKEYQRAYDLVLSPEEETQILTQETIPVNVAIALSELTEKEQNEIIQGTIPESIEENYTKALEFKQPKSKQKKSLLTKDITSINDQKNTVIIDKEEYEIDGVPAGVTTTEYVESSSVLIGRSANFLLKTDDPITTISGFGAKKQPNKSLKKAAELLKKKYNLPSNAILTRANFDADGNLVGAEFLKPGGYPSRSNQLRGSISNFVNTSTESSNFTGKGGIPALRRLNRLG